MIVKRTAAAFALFATLLTFGAVAPERASADTETAVKITVAPQDLTSLQPGQPLRLAVTILNPTAAPLPVSVVTVDVDRAAITTRADLSGWLANSAKGISATTRVARQEIPGIAPGETRVVTMSVPSSALGFSVAGVYALDARLATGTSAIATGRTAIVWKLGSGNPVGVAVAQALTVPASTAALIDASSLADYTAVDGLLTDQLDAALGTNVAIGIDPRILASIRVLGSSAPATATAWLARLEAAPNDTFPLAWADADLTVQLQAGASGQLQPRSLDYAIDPSKFAPVIPTPTDGSTASTPQPTTDPALPPLPDSAALVAWNYTLPGFAWPAKDTVVKRDLALISHAGYSTTMLSSGNLSRASRPVPAATAKVDDVSVVVSDADLSTLLRDAVHASSFDEWNSAMAQLSASVALVSELTPGSAPAMLATLDRSWSTSGFRLQQTLDALYARPWAMTKSLPSVLAQPATSAKLVERKQDGFRIRRTERLLEDEAADVRFATIAQQPELITSPLRLQLLALLSNDWETDPAGWQSVTDAFLTASQDLRSSVQVVDSSTINFLNDRGALPVTVSNKLEQAVTVYIKVTPQSPLIAVEDKRVKITIEPDSQRKGQVSVQSLSNGSVLVSVSLVGATGVRVGEVAQVKINVQAGWETAGTLIFAGFIVAIFAFGIFRNIRKRRRARRE